MKLAWADSQIQGALGAQYPRFVDHTAAVFGVSDHLSC